MYKRVIRMTALSLLLAAVTLLCLGAIGGLLFGYLALEDEGTLSLFLQALCRGKEILVLLVVIFGIALWWRCAGRIGDDAFRLFHYWKRKSCRGRK